MKRLTVIIGLIAALSVAGATPSLAQRGTGRGGGRMYNPSTVETVTGSVVKIEHVSGRGPGGGGGIHVLLDTGHEEIPVHLGPSWYLDQQSFKLAAQDRLEVRGSRVTFDGKPAIIAAEVQRGDQKLKLRDDNGIPLWSGRGGRP